MAKEKDKGKDEEGSAASHSGEAGAVSPPGRGARPARSPAPSSRAGKRATTPVWSQAVIITFLLGLCGWVLWKGAVTDFQAKMVGFGAALCAVFLLLSFFGGWTAVVHGTFRGNGFRVTGSVAAFLVVYHSFCYFAPRPQIKNVNIHLEHLQKPLLVDFRITARVVGYQAITQNGGNGVAVIPLPGSVNEIDGISVDCDGYKVEESTQGPFPLDGSAIRIPMIKVGDTVPLLPFEFPSEQSIPNLPSKEAGDAPSKLRPDQVAFRYKNLTKSNLSLLVLNVSKYYKQQNGPLKTVAWQRWPFPAEDQFQTYDQFQGQGSGWFCFFVEREKRHPADPGRFYVGSKNVFEQKVTTMVSI